MGKKEEPSLSERVSGLRLPKKEEIFGVIQKDNGGGHMVVKCKDGNVRTCRIPGRLRKRVWMRENDVVIVEPWQVQSNEKGDIVYRYTQTQIRWMEDAGIWNG